MLLQTKRRFEEKILVFLRRGKTVGKHIVDRGQARRIEPADRRHLHGRRAMRGNSERPAARRMTRKIDEDVDFIRMDAGRRLLRRQSRHIAPSVRQRTHLLRHAAARTARIVAIDVEAFPRAVGKQRQDEERIDLHGEIRRQIADAQSLVTMVRQLVRILPNACKEARKAAVLTKKPGIFHARQIVKRKEIVAVRHSVLLGKSAARRACRTIRLDNPAHIAQGGTG